LEELNSFDIIHTDLKPENVAIVLEPEDYPEDRIIKDFLDKKERKLLFTMEVSMLLVIFNKIVKFESLYKILFSSNKKGNDVLLFLKYCIQNKCLLDFLQPPYREKVLKYCKLILN
jgi:hypothetical protein